jgi:uncharacterized membrane protein
MKEKRQSSLTVVLLVVIAALAILGVVITILNPQFVFELQPGVRPGDQAYVPGGLVYETVYVLLTMVTNILYLVGGGIVFFGAILVTIRFLQANPEDPHKVHEVTRHLSGYLNMGLAFFIGAEIVKTVVVRTPEEFLLLVFIIVSRGLFSLILYLERRWHGAVEAE